MSPIGTVVVFFTNGSDIIFAAHDQDGGLLTGDEKFIRMYEFALDALGEKAMDGDNAEAQIMWDRLYSFVLVYGELHILMHVLGEVWKHSWIPILQPTAYRLQHGGLGKKCKNNFNLHRNHAVITLHGVVISILVELGVDIIKKNTLVALAGMISSKIDEEVEMLEKVC